MFTLLVHGKLGMGLSLVGGKEGVISSSSMASRALSDACLTDRLSVVAWDVDFLALFLGAI